MHPILRVTHCMKCHDFYNSGEFSKGEDGSELYCRWCGQGGEVYCCSSCPYVFCKSCIVKNLSKGVVADIEQNENWNCFSCAPKILWPLRAQHWALTNYIEVQKKEIASLNLPEHEYKVRMAQDRSKCCRLAKAKLGNMSDSMESLDSVTSKRSQGSSGSAKKAIKHSGSPLLQYPNPKRTKTNDEVVCTPDLLSMLEPDCQITVPQKNNNQHTMPQTSTPSPRPTSSLQQPYSALPQKNSAPPPLVLRNTAIKLRAPPPSPIVRRTVVGPRPPLPGVSSTPVYHTINGFRIDLNSAAQQDTFRLPNGKLIQVKRQGQPPGSTTNPSAPTSNTWQIQTHPAPLQQQQRIVPQTIASRPVQITQHPYPGPSLQPTTPQHQTGIRYHSNVIGSTTINPVRHNGPPVHILTRQLPTQQLQTPTTQPQVSQPQTAPGAPVRPTMLRLSFPDTPIGSARTQLQEQVFNAMEICTHLTNKVQTLTNSNAYKQAKNYLEVKELYIHLSYLLTYAIGRFKGLQDKCLADMRQLGFGNDADSLENGQLAADKQASDDEDNEIEIVEPKTDLINLDSDEDEPPPAKTQPANKSQTSSTNIIKHFVAHAPSGTQIRQAPVLNTPAVTPLNTISLAAPSSSPSPAALIPAPASASTPIVLQQQSNTFMPDYDDLIPPADDNMDLMTMAQSFLASMLEVDIHEGSNESTSTQTKKQPRKKLTNKPNPTLLKQKAQMERERLAEMKRNDLKLKMKCVVKLQRAEEVFPFVKDKLKQQLKENHKEDKGKATTVLVDMGKEQVEVQLLLVDESINISADEVINISEEGSPQKKTICLDLSDTDDETETKTSNKLGVHKKTAEEKLKIDKEKKKEVVKVKDIKTNENGKVLDSPNDVKKTEKSEDKDKEKKKNNSEDIGIKTDLNKSSEKATKTTTTTFKSEASKNDNSSQSNEKQKEEEDITMADVEVKENKEDKNNLLKSQDKELCNDKVQPMEVDSKEDQQSLTNDVEQIDLDEDEELKDSKTSPANVHDRKVCTPEIEDDEFYKEIEQVLQRRRHFKCDDVAEVKENVTEGEKENETEGEKEKVTEGGKEKVIEGEKENKTEREKKKITESEKGKVTESEKKNVTDGEKKNITKEEKEKITKGEKKNSTDGKNESIIEKEKEKITEGKKENETDGENESINDGDKEKITEGVKENVTDGEKENLSEGKEDILTEIVKDNVSEKEMVIESEKENVTESEKQNVIESEKENVTEIEKETDTEIDKEPELHEAIDLADEQTEKDEPLPDDTAGRTALADEIDIKIREKDKEDVSLKDSNETNIKDCNIEKEEKNTTATGDDKKKQATSSPEVTSNGKV